MPKQDLLQEQESEASELATLDSESMEIAALSAIDAMEQDYLREYYTIADKDKASGKDFNKVAHDEMVKAQHHFDMLRKMERADRAEAARVARKSSRNEN